MKGICPGQELTPSCKKRCCSAHSLLTEDSLEEGQQITEQEYCFSSADSLATGADRESGCPQMQLCGGEPRASFTAVISI